MRTNKRFHRRLATTAVTLCATIMLTMATPAYAAILVQNFMQFDFTVEAPPITKSPGVDDAATTYLTVNLGGTISNEDDTTGPLNGTDTYLSHEEISFTCFQGDRTYYTDVIQLNNVTAAEDWDVTLRVEADLNGGAATAYVDGNTDGDDDIDIWLFTSNTDSTGGLVTETPNPGSYGTLTQWLNGAAPNGAIQLEVIDSAMSILHSTTGAFTIPQGEQRQLALVVDCGENVETAADNAPDPGDSGTFRLTVEATPN
jgi:hypothetical protein